MNLSLLLSHATPYWKSLARARGSVLCEVAVTCGKAARAAFTGRAAILITHLAARIALADRVITLSERRITAPVFQAPSRATKLSGSDR